MNLKGVDLQPITSFDTFQEEGCHRKVVLQTQLNDVHGVLKWMA